MPGRGLQYLPMNDIPEKWDRVWFRDFVREVLALADVRNAIEGAGISIEGNSDTEATIGTGTDVEQLIDGPYAIAEPYPFLANARVLAGENGVIDVEDEGPGQQLTIGILEGGVKNAKIRPGRECSIIGRAANSVGFVADILAAANDSVLRRAGDVVSFGETPFGSMPTQVTDITFLTDADETTDYPNSRRLLAGTNISFDDSTPGERTVNATGGSGGIDHALQLDDFEDFINPRANTSGSSAPWSQFNGGTGAGSARPSAEGNHPGIWQLTTGTTSTGQAALSRGAVADTSETNGIILDADTLFMDFVFRMAVVPNGTQTYVARIGFCNELNAQPAEAVMLEVVNVSGNARWRLSAYTSSSPTSDTHASAGPADATWYHGRLAVTSSGATLSIDGVLVATLATGTGFPTGGMVWGMQIQKSAGNTARTLDVDLIHVYKTFSTPRY